MRYLKSYTIFENSVGLGDADILKDTLLNSQAGKDLSWINSYGYDISSKGVFSINEKTFKYIITKNSNGKWEIFHSRKRTILGEFDKPEDAFRYIWAIIVVRESDLPAGTSQEDYFKLLLSPDCPAWGLGPKKKKPRFSFFWIKRACEEYLAEKVHKSVKDFIGMFSDGLWQEKFDLIMGYQPGISPALIVFRPMVKNGIFKKMGFEHQEIKIPEFVVTFSPKKMFKSSYQMNRDLIMIVGGSSVPDMERKIISRYIKEIDLTSIGKYGPGKHPVLEVLKAILTEDQQNPSDLACHALGNACIKDASIFARIPKKYKKCVTKISGYQDDEVDAIIKALDYGIF